MAADFHGGGDGQLNDLSSKATLATVAGCSAGSTTGGAFASKPQLAESPNPEDRSRARA